MCPTVKVMLRVADAVSRLASAEARGMAEAFCTATWMESPGLRLSEVASEWATVAEWP